MKNILITGEKSYIGTSLIKWLNKEENKYHIDSISLRSENWKEIDFSKYDVVYHVAGIAHIRETNENQSTYFKINRDLAIEVAKRSKDCGVKQFIFLSTMSVYGMETGIITKETIPNPKNAYGKSKYEAEQFISQLKDNSFKIAILRPPMVYGIGCKGNYSRLSKLAKITPVFPEINNKRSMIFIDNLSEFVKYIIDSESEGIFLPQNQEYVNTCEMVKLIAEFNGRKLRTTKLFNRIIKLSKNSFFNKIFGDLVYEYSKESDSSKKLIYVDFKNSIRRTEIHCENSINTK